MCPPVSRRISKTTLRCSGAKNHDEIIPYYSAADFSILPSLMEATSISGLRSHGYIAAPGRYPSRWNSRSHRGWEERFLVRSGKRRGLGEKIDALLRVDLKAFGAHSRQMVEDNFAWTQIAQRTVKAYGTVL